MNSKDLLILIISTPFIITLIILHYYYNWETIKIKKKFGSKGLIYCILHNIVENINKDEKDYESLYYYINKYLRESLPPKETNIAEWQIAIGFWQIVLENFSTKLFDKLENKITISDVEYFNRLVYSDQTKPIFKKEISTFLKELGLAWASKRGTIQRANQLGYFAIMGNIAVDDYETFTGIWLDAWNDFLGLEGKKRLKIKALVTNPLDTNGRRTIDNNVKDVKKIHEIFQKVLKWETGIKLVENLLKE